MSKMDAPELLDALLPPIVKLPGLVRTPVVAQMQALLEAVNADPMEMRVLELFGLNTTGIA